MAKQQVYDTPQTVTESHGRVKAIYLYPNQRDGEVSRDGVVEVVFVLGEDLGGGSFVEHDTKVLRKSYADLPAPVQATLDDLEDKALNAGESAGLLPTGTIADIIAA